MLNDASTSIFFDNGISFIYRDFASSSSVGKNGALGSAWRKKSPKITLHLGQV